MRPQMSNQKLIRQVKSGAEVVWPGLFRSPLPLLLGTFFSAFLEFTRVRLLRHRRLQLAGAAQHNEPPVTIANAGNVGSLADDRATPPFL